MTKSIKLTSRTRLVSYTFSLLSLVYAGLTGWIFFSMKTFDLRVTLTLVVGMLIILTFFALYWILIQTESLASKERNLKNYSLSALRRFFENETNAAVIIKELKDFPTEILKKIACAFSPRQRELIIRHLATEIAIIERWKVRNPQPKDIIDDSGAAQNWVSQDDNLQDLMRLRNALKE